MRPSACPLSRSLRHEPRHHFAHHPCLDVDRRPADMAAQRQLGLHSKRRAGHRPDHRDHLAAHRTPVADAGYPLQFHGLLGRKYENEPHCQEAGSSHMIKYSGCITAINRAFLPQTMRHLRQPGTLYKCGKVRITGSAPISNTVINPLL